MSRTRSWSDQDLAVAVERSFSYRAVIKELGLVPAGGNYLQVTQRINYLKLPTGHFTGKGWNRGKQYSLSTIDDVRCLLIKGSNVQSYKLKHKLFIHGLKQPQCELCGWCQQSQDGRVPVELDHINGDRFDNRLENLRILCPNCHSLQLTHRGKNKKMR